MPELPEVEVIRRGLAPRLTGRTIVAITAGSRKLRKPVPRARLKKWVAGARIAAVERRAKFLLFRLENRMLLVIHLGMTGRLGLYPSGAAMGKHDHLRFFLEGGEELRFSDVRRFGSVEVCTEEEWQSGPAARLGPEPFWEDFSSEYLLGRAANRKTSVKSFLMDSSVVVGIGNIYASEILFAAGISPSRPASSLSRREWQRVVEAARSILKQAIAGGGTTIADFVDGQGKKGSFQHALKVYGRAGRPCSACQEPLSRTIIAGRSTFHCRRCQR